MSAFNCRSTNYFGASNFDVRSKSGAKTPRTPKHFVRNAQQAPLRFAQLSECDRVLASLLLLQVIRGVSIDIVRYRSTTWMGDRVVDCARLESVCAERHRGFESPPIRVRSLALAFYRSVKFRVSLLPVVPVVVSPCCRERERRGN